MKHFLTIIGARPQFIKAAALSRAIASLCPDKIAEHILHTGQHYDANMSQVFFDELDLPLPEFRLSVGSSTHGRQTADMISGIEDVLLSHTFDGIILYGDTNSTLAGTIAASKLHIPIYHIEAGLRSFNMDMPEEINRIVCDRLSSLLFAPTQTAVANLQNEGFSTPNCPGKVVLSGDVMYDNSLFFSSLAQSRCDILNTLDLQPANYLLATVHRADNTDNPHRLSSVFQALIQCASSLNTPVIIPLHPRTRSRLSTMPHLLSLLNQQPLLRIVNPLSFFEMILLEQNARLVLTDSGGVQKEAYFFKKPCVILRPESEWVEIVNHQAAIIADADPDSIVNACHTLTLHPPTSFPNLFGDGHAAEHILQHLL